MTMTLVSTVTVGSGGAASIDFTSIPQTGTDLLIMLSGRGSRASTDSSIKLTFNGSTTDYVDRELEGNGSAAGSYTNTWGGIGFYVGTSPAASATSSTFGSSTIIVPNYSGIANKSISADTVTENNASTAKQHISAGSWSASAITSLSLSLSLGTWVQYSTASLYTITKGSGGATVS